MNNPQSIDADIDVTFQLMSGSAGQQYHIIYIFSYNNILYGIYRIKLKAYHAYSFIKLGNYA